MLNNVVGRNLFESWKKLKDKRISAGLIQTEVADKLESLGKLFINGKMKNLFQILRILFC
ncbi:hypothetical protein DW277_17095 [Clostridium botulinum]|nr:hypothetical protein [Staphylococcus xylosus]MCS6105604.1 hypothetical protein [Clostridium botulinum]